MAKIATNGSVLIPNLKLQRPTERGMKKYYIYLSYRRKELEFFLCTKRRDECFPMMWHHPIRPSVTHSGAHISERATQGHILRYHSPPRVQSYRRLCFFSGGDGTGQVQASSYRRNDSRYLPTRTWNSYDWITFSSSANHHSSFSPQPQERKHLKRQFATFEANLKKKFWDRKNDSAVIFFRHFAKIISLALVAWLVHVKLSTASPCGLG